MPDHTHYLDPNLSNPDHNSNHQEPETHQSPTESSTESNEWLVWDVVY